MKKNDITLKNKKPYSLVLKELTQEYPIKIHFYIFCIAFIFASIGYALYLENEVFYRFIAQVLSMAVGFTLYWKLKT